LMKKKPENKGGVLASTPPLFSVSLC